MARMKDFYKETVAPALFKKFGYKSVMQIPKIDKIIVNVACGEAKENHKIIENVMSELAQITGQKPVECRSKKAVANFKLREGQVIGVKVTLRGEIMYEFLDRLFNVALPRVRGNYSFGLKEQIIFPEIDFDKIEATRGMDINFVTTAKTDEEARELLTLMGAPFEK